MDSLRSLSSSLPTAALAGAEEQLLNDFRGAAQSITTLYRSARETSKRAYNAGYAQACTDVLELVQRSVSEGAGVERIMDWVEARLEAVRRDEEEEEEGEDSQRRATQSQRSTQQSATPIRHASPAPSMTRSPRRRVPSQTETRSMSPPQGRSGSAPAAAPAPPQTLTPNPSAAAPSPAAAVSPAPTPTHTPATIPNFHQGPNPMPLRPLPFNRPIKSRPGMAHQFPMITHPMGSSSPSSSPSMSLEYPEPIPMAGAKRRHGALSLDSNTSPPVAFITPAGAAAGIAMGMGVGRAPSRKQKRGANSRREKERERDEAMDVEEDGRERKRVARR